MAEKDNVKEPAKPNVEQVTEPAQTEGETVNERSRKFDPRKKVFVYDTQTKEKLTRPVPETYLDGRFPNLKLVPSTNDKKGN